MSQENIELVSAIFDGWAERGVEAMLPFFAEDIDYLPMEEGGTSTGQVWLIRDGKALRWEEYLDHEEALAALGLRG